MCGGVLNELGESQIWCISGLEGKKDCGLKSRLNGHLNQTEVLVKGAKREDQGDSDDRLFKCG